MVGLTRLDGKQTAIISLYLDITTTVAPDFFIKALEYCKRRRYAVIIGADTNAHHKLWGKETNKRGEELEQTLSDYNLIVHICCYLVGKDINLYAVQFLASDETI